MRAVLATLYKIFLGRVGRMAAACLLAAGMARAVPQVQADPAQAAAVSALVSAGQLNGACYIATPSTCKLRVDAIAVNVASGRRLVGFDLQANAKTVYAFRTDVSNPPGAGTYITTAVRHDFAARCGETYTLRLLARDTGEASWLVTGMSGEVTCPQGRYDIFAPAIRR